MGWPEVVSWGGGEGGRRKEEASRSPKYAPARGGVWFSVEGVWSGVNTVCTVDPCLSDTPETMQISGYSDN